MLGAPCQCSAVGLTRTGRVGADEGRADGLMTQIGDDSEWQNDDGGGDMTADGLGILGG